MAEYIERERLRDVMRNVTEDTTCPLHIAATIDQIIDYAPPADVVEVVRCRDCKYLPPESLVRHGRWEDKGRTGYICSVCEWGFEWWEPAEAHYCPHCGAKMDLNEQEELKRD